ncbi:MAG: cytochrome c [Bacteroidota bacterium]|nr:cytochrome c [Bacteroidota bacterium]MDP4234229.1 cytochrome c [Bacteroidota bacterium]MDP4243419.1 cytochrome c [Bacteroidota bacterium]
MKNAARVLALAFSICSPFTGCNSGDNQQNSHAEASMQGSSAGAPDLSISMTPEAVSRGRATYMSSCAVCHGTQGRGDGPAAAALAAKPRDHTNGAYMDKLSNSHIYKVVKFGGVMFGYPAMPAQPSLGDDEIKDLIAFVRTLSSTYRRS